MNKKLSSLLSATLCSAMLFSANVAFGYNLSYEGGDSDFIISGKTAAQTAGLIITVKVEKTIDGEDELIFARQTLTGPDGSYLLTFNIEQLGEARLTVSENGVISPAGPSDIYKSTDAEVNTVLELLNGEGDEASIIADGNNSKILQVKLDEFIEKNADSIISDYLAGKSYISISDFASVYNKGYFLAELKTETNGNILIEAAQNVDISDMLSNSNAKNTFLSMSDEEKASVLEGIAGETYKTDSAFSDALLGKVIVNQINSATLESEKWGVVEENNDFLGLTLSTYTALAGNFDKFKEKVFEYPILSVADLKSKITTQYSKFSDGNNSGLDNSGKITNPEVDNELISPPVSPKPIGFDDLKGYEWAQNAILSLAIDGVINGKADRVFAPGDNVTRAEFTKIIVSAFNLVSDSVASNFSDVDKNHWSYKFISSAVKERLVTGVDANNFNPQGKITRQDMAVICYRTLDAKKIKLNKKEQKMFTDSNKISEYAREAVETLAAAGIINGKDNGAFEPMSYATRAEAAKLIYALSNIN